MQEDLKLNWGVRSEVLYDKANLNIFNLMDIDQKHEFFKKGYVRIIRTRHSSQNPRVMVFLSTNTKPTDL